MLPICELRIQPLIHQGLEIPEDGGIPSRVLGRIPVLSPDPVPARRTHPARGQLRTRRGS